uniref:sensor histidine kinase n=3 Tax=Roseivirga sp. TaxID=1964215 RepID=UPI0040471966
ARPPIFNLYFSNRLLIPRIFSRTTVISYYQKSLNILFETNRLRDVATVKHNLATYYTRRGQLDAALNEINSIIELAETNNWHGSLEDLYLLKMVILNSRGQYKEAYEISRKSYLSKIVLMEDQYAIGVDELQAVHDKELAEKALAEAEIRAESNESALTYTIIGILLFGLSTVTALLLFLKVRKNNKLLTDQQKSIELTNEMLLNSLDEKEALYKELNHRVKNNLTVLSSLIYLQQHSKNSEDSINDLYTALRNRIQTMAIVHEKLYGINNAKNINFQNYLEDLIPLIYSSFRKGDIIMPYTVRCMSLFLPINKAIPLALIFNELITNSIKHSTDDSLAKGIHIESHTDENATVITFEDFGPQFPIEINFSNPSGMGMKIVNLMTQQLKATLEHQSTESGLRFTIKFN